MLLKLAATLTIAGVIALPALNSAKAAIPVDPLAKALTSANAIEETQFVWNGNNYCWYGNGWRGPGWYRCRYAWRRGLGWGGGYGWRGWRCLSPAICGPTLE